MIEDVDEALRQLLIQEIPIRNGEVDITFDQPKREWSARLNRPTLNFFLYDVRENKKLRGTQPIWDVEQQNGNTVTKRRRPLRVDLRYIITAWATEPDDEHRLLSRALAALSRYSHLPQDSLPDGLQDQPMPLPIMVAQEEDFRNPADLWGAIDNEWRPAIPCVITLALNPYLPITAPLVRTREIRFGEAVRPVNQGHYADGIEPDVFWTVGGTVRSDKSPDDIQVVLMERDLTVHLQPGGRFAIGNLRAGDYTLEISVKGRKKAQRHTITVPAADYVIEV
jgi:hypothetical protein